MARLQKVQWEAIRRVYEFNPSRPSFEVSGRLAAEKYEFEAPSKQAIHQRAHNEGWKRNGTMAGVTAEANHRADSYRPDEITNELRAHRPIPDEEALRNSPVMKAQLAFEEASEKRASIIARHRQEWEQIARLRQEAVKDREENLARAQNRAKLAKTAAEVTAIQQTGERRAWGLDDVQMPDFESKSDEELKALAGGRKTIH